MAAKASICAVLHVMRQERLLWKRQVLERALFQKTQSLLSDGFILWAHEADLDVDADLENALRVAGVLPPPRYWAYCRRPAAWMNFGRLPAGAALSAEAAAGPVADDAAGGPVADDAAEGPVADDAAEGPVADAAPRRRPMEISDSRFERNRPARAICSRKFDAIYKYD